MKNYGSHFILTIILFFFIPSVSGHTSDSNNISQHSVQETLKEIQEYNNIGQLEIALFFLEKILPSLEKNSLEKAVALGLLGDNHNLQNNFESAIKAYRESLEIKTNLAVLNNLIITYRKKIEQIKIFKNNAPQESEIQKYLKEIEISQNRRKYYLNQALSLSSQEKYLANPATIQTLIELSKSKSLEKFQVERGSEILISLPPSDIKIFLLLDWAKIDVSRNQLWLKDAQKVAIKVKNQSALATVYLELSLIAERNQNFTLARQAAQFATKLAQSTANYQTLFRSWWLLARIDRKFEYYQKAIAALKFYRQQQAISSRRANYTDETEVLYREALTLLFANNPSPKTKQLELALNIFKEIQLAQLQQFFGDDCTLIESQAVSLKQSSGRVTLTSIVLKNATHLIIQLPDGTMKYNKVKLSQENLEQLATDWYNEIATGGFEGRFKIRGEKLYKLLIQPFESFLENKDLIVFVNDGILRNIPTAALFDGNRYIAEKWAVASSLGFKVEIINPKKPNYNQKTIAFGLSEKRLNWTALLFVDREINAISKITGAEQLLNKKFTRDRFKKEIENQQPSTIHLATHAYFGGVVENSFLLAYDGKIGLQELEQSLRGKYINLLVLSACDTAFSSPLSPLGLSGIGIRNGIDQVIGTYWQVDDSAQSEVMLDFYGFSQEMNYFSALQRAQIQQIEKKATPYNWASINLIVN